MSSKYAVAVTLIGCKPGTVLNVGTHLFVFDASNEDEARGRANREASEQSPGHSIFSTLIAAIDDEGGGQSQENQK